jgi:catecholate siderophore receptor
MHQVKRRNLSDSRSAAYWAALGAIAACTTFGSDSNALAQTQAAAPRNSAPTQAQLPVRRFAIAASPLDRALQTYHDTTGIVVHVTLPPDTIANFTSPGVTGLFTNEQALRELLSGTALSYRFTGAQMISIGVAGSDVVEVTAAAPTVIGRALPKYTAPLNDTPQSIAVVPQAVLAEQGATTLRDALRNVAGISLAAGEGGAQGDNLTIRGFTSRNDIFIDGMRDFGSYYRDPFNLEEVEVLKGPSSVTFGRGSTGGVVNQAYKTAELDSFMGATVALGSDRTRRTTVDVNEPLPMLGDGAALRLNLLGHASDVADRDVAKNRRFGIAPSLVLGLGSATRYAISYLHQSANDVPDYGVPWLFTTPAPVPRQNYYGFADGNHLDTSVHMGTVKVEHDVSDKISIRNQVRYASYSRDALITEAKIAGSVGPDTPLENVSVNRSQIAAISDETFLQNQLDLTATFTHGGVTHAVVAGIELGRETSNPTRLTYSGVPATSLLDPNPRDVFAGTPTVTSNVHTTSLSSGAYLIDTMKVGARWELTGGLRWDRFDTDYHNSVAPAVAFRRVDSMPSWRSAVVYKPAPNGSIYAGYSTSFNPSAEALSLAAASANTAPEKNRTMEVGAKWELGHERLSMRTAFFRTDKFNAREPDPDNPLQNVLSGSQRVTGQELELNGRVTAHWRLLGSYSHMKSELVKSEFYPLAVGGPLGIVPENTASLWSSHILPHDMELGAGAQYVGSRTASTTAPFDPTTGLRREVAGYTTFNAMARRRITDRIELQLNVNNLTNTEYYDQIHPAHVVPGAGRSALLTVTIRPQRGEGR